MGATPSGYFTRSSTRVSCPPSPSYRISRAAGWVCCSGLRGFINQRLIATSSRSRRPPHLASTRLDLWGVWPTTSLAAPRCAKVWSRSLQALCSGPVARNRVCSTSLKRVLNMPLSSPSRDCSNVRRPSAAMSSALRYRRASRDVIPACKNSVAAASNGGNAFFSCQGEGCSTRISKAPRMARPRSPARLKAPCRPPQPPNFSRSACDTYGANRFSWM
mmetsp:Transcript_96951/g.274564  ORF Transcript_96951/g.274564 Transcript_96951/m.274564 type:complete len:218 (-) Transcript_96951:308-961(-)